MIPITEMDEFIKKYASIYYQNPNLEISEDTIYSELANYGFTKSEINNGDVTNEFDALVFSFSRSKHLRVSQDIDSSFVRFYNWEKSGEKAIKLYLSFPKAYLSYATKRIFDFIDRKKIETSSKVAGQVRSDGMVIRVTNEKDAEKILDFVNSDRSLVSISRATNPFILRDGAVGIAYDDMISYNKLLSFYLASYYKELQKRDLLNTVSINSFSAYLSICYQNIFVDCKDLIKFTESTLFKKSLPRINSVGHAIYNFQQVSSILNSLCKGELNLENFYDFYKRCDDKDKTALHAKEYADVYNYKLTEDKKNLLDNYIIYALAKYGTADKVVNYLQGYINGYTESITKDRLFRIKFINKLNAIDITNLTNGNIAGYVYEVAGIELKPIDIINKAAIATGKKYGIEHMSFAFQKAVKGDYSSITNDGNARTVMKEKIKPEKIKDLCKEYLKDQGQEVSLFKDIINSYVAYIYNTKVYNQENVVSDQGKGQR